MKYEIGDEIRVADKFNTLVADIQGLQVWFKDEETKDFYYLRNNDPRLQLIKKAEKVKTIFGQGLFIRKDDFSRDCCIGDKVEVIRPAMVIEHDVDFDNKEDVEIPEHTFTGTLVLLKTRGVLVKLNTGKGTNYVKAPLTNRSRNLWKWRKL